MGKIVLVVYAVLVAIGGIMGAAKGSMVSLVAGLGAALVLGVAAFLSGSNPKLGFGIGVVMALALAGRFWGSFQKNGVMPFGLLFGVSIVAVLLLLVSLVQNRA